MKSSKLPTKVASTVREFFPDSRLISVDNSETGLVNKTFFLKIENPKKKIVARQSKLKNAQSVLKNNKILEYLYENNLPVPETYCEKTFGDSIVTLMEFIEGKNAGAFYNNSSNKKRKSVLENAGSLLSDIHKLEIPSFWKHQKHPIKNKKGWLDWTRQRIDKYLKFVNENYPSDYDFIEEELEEFYSLLTKKYPQINFVPLHWDYHLDNMLVNKDGQIKGIFDFDNAVKGHNLADLGQTEYWIMFHTEKTDNFEDFLKGYDKNLKKYERKLVEGYFLLHILGVSRSIWKSQPRLSWILKKHEDMLNELKRRRS